MPPEMPVVTLAGAAASEDRLLTLRALRNRLASEIDVCDSARDVAALSRQLTDVLGLIAQVPTPAAEETPLERIRRQRAEVADAATG